MSIEAPVLEKKGAILVTGAAGGLGVPYVKELARRHPDGQVIAMGRDNRHASIFAGLENVQAIEADVTNPGSLKMVFDSASTDGNKIDTVFHLAALLQGTPEAIHRVNVEGTQHLVDAANTAGVDKFHLVSSVGTYGSQEQEVVGEDAPPNATDAYGISKAEQEKIVFSGDNRFTASAIRVANAWGPHTDPWEVPARNLMEGIETDAADFKLREQLQGKTARRVMKGLEKLKLITSEEGKVAITPLGFAVLGHRRTFPYVVVDNAIDLSIRAVNSPNGDGQVFNAVDANPTLGEMASEYAKGVYGKETPKSARLLGSAVVKTVSGFLRMAGKRELAEFALTGTTKYDNTKARDILGHTPRVSFADSIANTRAAMEKETTPPRSQLLYEKRRG